MQKLFSLLTAKPPMEKRSALGSTSIVVERIENEQRMEKKLGNRLENFVLCIFNALLNKLSQLSSILFDIQAALENTARQLS